MTQQKAQKMLARVAQIAHRLRPQRTRSHIASCASSGTHAAVNCPAHEVCASIIASRR